jgi:hypothetical protein
MPGHFGSHSKDMSETSLYSRGSAATELPIIMCQASQPQTEKTTNSVPATDSSWGAIRVFLAVVCSEGLLFGQCIHSCRYKVADIS